MKRILAAAVAAIALAAPAAAQQSAPFTGIRVEALGGYDAVNVPGLQNPDGFLYGLGIGYDVQTSNGLLLGVEADITDSTAKVKLPGPDLKAGRDIYVGGRIGTVVGDAVALYAKAGYTNARISYAGEGANGDGFRLGAGVEYALGQNMFVKGEYRYSNYEADLSRNQIVGGFGFRF